MPQFHVFLKAPTLKELKDEGNDQDRGSRFQWHNVVYSNPQDTDCSTKIDAQLPPASLEAASRRISMLYENIIFRDNHEDGEAEYVGDLDPPQVDGNPGNTQEPTTFFTWLPTTVGDGTRLSQSAFINRRETTFLRGLDSFGRSHIQGTQETQETNSYSEIGGGASDTSIARFPEFNFSLHNLSSLAALEHGPSDQDRGNQAYQVAYPFESNKRKVCLLVAILEVEGPDTIHIKKGVDAGKAVSILKVIVGDEDGAVCRLTAWREVAEQWGGSYTDTLEPSLKRGDIVYLQNILVSKDFSAPTVVNSMATSSVSLTASPALRSAMSICYRTMPLGNDLMDAKLRPDLRLGYSDAAVRKVSAVVRWFQGMAGLPVL